MNDEKIWKKVVVACVRYYYQHLLGETEENHKTLSSIAGVLAEI
jgi:hypothetical protein